MSAPTSRRERRSAPYPLIYARFWIRSSRGTDRSGHETVALYGGDEEDDIREALETWCSQFGAWYASENFVRYGYEVIGRNVTPKERAA